MKTQKLTILFIVFVLSAIKSFGYTERNLLQKSADLEKLKTSLIMNQKWVQYPSYEDRNGWDKLVGELKSEYIYQGEKKLSYVWQIVKATDYLEFERSGNRSIMEGPLNNNLVAIYDLFMAELAEGKGRFTDQLINGAFNLCEMTSWSLSAHLGSQATRRHLPDHREHYIDLMAGDVGAMLAWIHYYFNQSFDKVDPVISERIRYELKNRIMEPYVNQDNFWWMAVNYRPGMMVNNWNPWCNSSVLQTFLLIENDPDKLAKAVYRSMVSVDKFINYTHDDGACEEGPAYWESAAGKMYDYLQLLSDATDRKIDIFSNPVIKEMGEYIVHSYIGNGWVVNFADASAKGGGNLPLIYRYGKAVGSSIMLQHATSGIPASGRKSALARCDIYRGFQTLIYDNEMTTIKSNIVAKNPYTWYPDTEFCYMTNKNGFFIASKGGYNNESHNHNDVGSFVLYVNNTPVFIDAGVGTYTRQTFSKERYTIWTMQSDYHNLPAINGVSQAYGKQYKAKNVSFNPKKKNFIVDITTAYPAEAKVNQWLRSYSLGSNELKIEDKFDLEEVKGKNKINFLTSGTVDISQPGQVIISIKNEKLVLTYDKNLFTPSIETVKLNDLRLSEVWGDAVYRISMTANKLQKAGNYTFSIRQTK